MSCPTKSESAHGFEFARIPCVDLFQNLGECCCIDFDELLVRG